MVVCDARPGYPPDRTVRADRRPCDPFRRACRPGRPKRLSDAELVCLAVAQVLLGARSEHHWLRLCYARLGHLFPYLPTSPATTSGSRPPRRCWPRHRLPGRLCRPGPTSCGCSTPPRCRAAPRGRPSNVRSWPAGRLRLLRRAFALVLGAEAVPDHHRGGNAGGLVPGQPEDRRTRGRRGAAGQPPAPARCATGLTCMGDKGLSGGKSRTWSPTGYRCTWSAPTATTRHPATASIGWIRQWIESVNDTLKGQLDLERHGGRTAAASTPASPNGCWPWPPPSGTTGPPAHPSSDR